MIIFTRTSFKYGATIIFTMVIVAAVTLIYYTHDPVESVSPQCMFRLLTGYECPGCGAQRCFHALLHGHFSEAWSYNPFLFFAVPCAIVFIGVEMNRKRRPELYHKIINPITTTAITAATLAWWIFRNV